jgi:Helicase associated domain
VLGHWVSNQRQKYKTGTMEESRKRRLQELGFLWASRPLNGLTQPLNEKNAKISQEAYWTLKFGELQTYYAKHGDCNVPTVGGVRGRSWCCVMERRIVSCSPSS